MSSVAVNDENRGVCPGGKQNSNIDDIFAIDQPTGRPSILRQSENLPCKTVQKGSKVCFQTPRRDPHTKRILLSPTKSVKMISVDECTQALGSITLDKTNNLAPNATEQPEEPTQEVSSYPDDNMPIQSKGGYQLDFENLEAMNPFQGSSKMVLSPARPAVENPPTDQTEPQHVQPENMPEELTKIQSALEFDNIEAINPFQESSKMVLSPARPAVENPPTDQTEQQHTQPENMPEELTKIESALEFDNIDAINPFQGSSKVVLSPAKPAVENPPTDYTEQQYTQPENMPEEVTKIQSALEFDNIDSINPFQGSSKVVLSPAKPAVENPPMDQTEQQHTQPENIPEELTKMESALDETLPFTPSVENSMVDISANTSSTESSVVTVSKIEEHDSMFCTPDVKPSSKMFSEDAPLPAKGSYSFDFDNLDEINPFQSGGPKIQNSPDLGRKVPDKTLVEETQTKENDIDIPEVAQEVSVQPEVTPIAAVTPIPDHVDKPSAAESESQPDDVPVKEGPIKLEFNFDDGSEVKKKPPPKKFGKRPPGLKPKVGKPVSDLNPAKETPVELAAGDVADVPLPKASYSVDFNTFEDPYFNPFGTKEKMTNSPKCSKKSDPVLMGMSVPEQTDKPVEEEAVPPACAGESVPAAETNPGANAEHEATPDNGIQLEAEQKFQSAASEFNDEFVPGTMFMANDFDGQMDYLEQFGSGSFKESALRKQSLYLKFDPLMRESPKKSASAAPQTHVARPGAFVSRLETAKIAEEVVANGAKTDNCKLFDDFTAPAPPILEGLVPPFHQPENKEDAIIEVLKYSQKDMDEAIARVQAEASIKEGQWSAKYKKQLDDCQEMRKIIAEFELIIGKMMADQEEEKKVSQEKLDAALLENEQVSRDLNAMEKSFSNLFKRQEKYKEVIEGYKKNEETLKACAQDYLARIKKEEQRYQTLKAHAEEKIGHANNAIAEVRSKNNSEVSALQAQLRREQLKVQSLDKSLNQKEREAEDLTKLCDELISKVKRG